MSHVSTFEIASENIILDDQLQDIRGWSLKQGQRVWNQFQKLVSMPVFWTRTSYPQTLSHYYDGAFDRTTAATPIVTFRALV